MAATSVGGKKIAGKIKQRDPEFYRRIGAKGGRARVPKGFATLDRWDLSDVSRKGAEASAKSRRTAL